MALGKKVDVAGLVMFQRDRTPMRLLRTVLAGARGLLLRWTGVKRESLTQATDLVLEQGGGGCAQGARQLLIWSLTRYFSGCVDMVHGSQAGGSLQRQ